MPRDLHVRMRSVIDSQTASSLLLVSSNWRKTKKAFLMINPASLNYVVLAPIPPSRHFQNLYRDFALSNFQRITYGRNRTSRNNVIPHPTNLKGVHPDLSPKYFHPGPHRYPAKPVLYPRSKVGLNNSTAGKMACPACRQCS